MKKSGYYRWLFSYLPVFFSIISILVFIFFLAISGYSRQQAGQANEIFTRNVMQAMDSFLRFTEQTIVQELLTDEKFTLFYDPFQQMTPFQTYEVMKKIRTLAAISESIDSIYLYRLSDHRVLTTNTMIPLEQFDDRAFVEQNHPLSFAWSNSRSYKELRDSGFSRQVVSLVKKVPLLTGSQGLIVVNVRTSAIGDMFNELSSSDISFIKLLDADDQLFFGETYADGKELSRIQSDYSGWTYVSGFKSKQIFDIFSILSNMWLYLAGATVAAGTIWLIMVIRKNYKPIDLIRESIQQYALNKNMELIGKISPNELTFIKGAIENLMEQSNRYEEKFKENLTYRRKWFFQQVMEGGDSNNIEDLGLEIVGLGLLDNFEQLTVAILEIDLYADFCRTYNHGDQQLLKLVLAGVIREMAEAENIRVWSEWVGEGRIGILFSFREHTENDPNNVNGFCDNVRCWVEQNLKFTVSFGIGGMAKHVKEVSAAYNDALQALQYKTALGNNKTICYRDIELMPQGQMFRYVDEIRLLAQHYRLGEEGWKHNLHHLITGLRTAVLPRMTIVSLMNYVIYSLQKEMIGLPAEIQELWERQSMPQLNVLLQQFDGIEELEIKFFDILNDTAAEIHLLRENRSNHKLIHQVKDYIEAHYANPDLSLEHLNDEFHLNVKTLSRLFKEEFGEKFVDYLARVRIENAKTRLTEQSAEPIQHIALRVGYYNTFTFIRVFKKVVGVTPGEYRKEAK